MPRPKQEHSNNVFRAAIKENALSKSALAPFVAEASKDASFPITQEIMNLTIFPYCLYLQPSTARFDAVEDYRNQEVANFQALAELIVEESSLSEWVQRQRNVSISNPQLKARRIWHKGSVLTWGPYLKDIIINTFNIKTEDERTKLLYRPELTAEEKARIKTYLGRLFSHPMWD
ncbi:MAG: chromosome partitioning protein ParB, partial [Chloroflexi bacterium]|nr:chromosome partitioning protein ParB [Chloroflexota bacterium]